MRATKIAKSGRFGNLVAVCPRTYGDEHLAETQVEARRLDLAFNKGIGRQDQAGIRHRRDHAIGQDAIGAGCERERQLRFLVPFLAGSPLQTLKIGPFTGYPMPALTERPLANMSMTYPVVI